MSFTRKGIETTLKANGVTENLAEIVNAIIEQHTEVTDALKEQIKGLKDVQTKLDDVTKERDSLKAKVDGDKSAEKITELENQIKEYQAKETKALDESDYKAIFKEAGLNETMYGLVLNQRDLKSITRGKDGSVENRQELIDYVKETYADHIVTTTKEGHTPPNPNNNNSGGTMTREQIYERENGRYKYDTATRQKMLTELETKE